MTGEEIEKYRLKAEVESIIFTRRIGMGVETDEIKRRELEEYLKLRKCKDKFRKDIRDSFSVN